MSGSGTAKLALPQVTLCAVTSVNVEATVRALEETLAQIDFADCLLFTDSLAPIRHPAIRRIAIKRIRTARAYSEFLFRNLADHILTSHCLVVQWDGYVLDADRWDPVFLEYDYIGATWPQFHDDRNVGNGGFSLRSRRVLAACKDARFADAHPEDIMIGRVHRGWLEEQGLRFAPAATADRFSSERGGDVMTSFGFHGIWHMPRILGRESFWEVYRLLDNRDTVQHDFATLAGEVVKSDNGICRVLRMLVDRALDQIRKRK